MVPSNNNAHQIQAQPQLDSIYYVHSSDIQNVVLVTPKLDGSSYAG